MKSIFSYTFSVPILKYLAVGSIYKSITIIISILNIYTNKCLSIEYLLKGNYSVGNYTNKCWPEFMFAQRKLFQSAKALVEISLDKI